MYVSLARYLGVYASYWTIVKMDNIPEWMWHPLTMKIICKFFDFLIDQSKRDLAQFPVDANGQDSQLMYFQWIYDCRRHLEKDILDNLLSFCVDYQKRDLFNFFRGLIEKIRSYMLTEYLNGISKLSAGVHPYLKAIPDFNKELDIVNFQTRTLKNKKVSLDGAPPQRAKFNRNNGKNIKAAAITTPMKIPVPMTPPMQGWKEHGSCFAWEQNNPCNGKCGFVHKCICCQATTHKSLECTAVTNEKKKVLHLM